MSTLEVSELELQTGDYFQTNKLRQEMNTLIPILQGQAKWSDTFVGLIKDE